MNKKLSPITKGFATFYIIISIFCLSVCSVFATDISYNLDEIGMTLEIPDNMQVITRETPKDDLVFSTFGLDYQSIMNDFESRSIYLQAADVNNFLTLTVTRTSTEESQTVDNYNKLSEQELDSVVSKFMSNPAYQSCEEKEINGCKYLCLLVSEQVNGNYVYSQQYNTVVSGENYTISLQAPNSQQLKSDDKATFDRIMKSVEIREKTFFSQYGTTVLLVLACVIAFAGVIVLFVILFKFITNPKRKDNSIIHQLAHEHKITETARIPREKLRKYMIENAPKDSEDFMEEYEPLVEKGAKREKTVTKINNDASTKEVFPKNIDLENTEATYEPATVSKAVANEDAVIVEEIQNFGGTDYFSDVPDEQDMYVYSDVDKAVDDYSIAKRRATDREKQQSNENLAIRILKAIGKGIVSFFQTVFVVIIYLVVHIRYFCINLYRLIKRKINAKKRRKMQEENKRRAEERRKRQREAEMYRQRENRNRGENDLVMVHSRRESLPAEDYRRNRPRRR